MTSEGDLGLKAETIIELPIETLAFAVLENYATTNGWSRHNWLIRAKDVVGRGPHLNALAEAWAWLEARCLVAPTPDETSTAARIVTRAGRRAIQKGSLDEVLAAERIGLALHPLLEGKIRPVFLLGDYETAAFKAMKEVEVRVRELAALPNDLIGVSLIRQAFNPNGGPLSDPSHEGGERQARSDLFAGTIGSFKNPTSHRTVSYADPTEASEVILLADLLMRILDTVKKSPAG
ncbi:TIGR02391 family protein [Geomonas anaerohicana]|nr:TIGR02391 family protein [Geomonas anaerohicana]